MSATGLESLRVLLVEDNANMRRIVTTMLSGIGFRHIREAGDGDDAIGKLKGWTADFVLADFQMAPIDGVEFTRRIRTAEDSPDPFLPIIMMTGHTERARVMEARDAGVTEFVVKPLTARAVMDRIYAVINKPRPFVRCSGYFGPDRRRRQDPRHPGPWRRQSDVPPTTLL